MQLTNGLRIILCAALGVATTAGAYSLDRLIAERRETESALKWARQIVSQAESMELDARESGTVDSWGKAIDYLALGVEPRLVRISRITPNATPSQNPELFQLEPVSGIFDYTRTFNFEEGTGIRIQLDVGAAGLLRKFLGTRTKLGQDFAVGGTFTLLFFSLLSFTAFLVPKPKPEVITLPPILLPPDRKEIRRIRSAVTRWSGDSKSNLTQLGTHVRDLIKQAQVMANSAKNSKAGTAELRDKIHAGLGELHGAHQNLKSATKLVSFANQLISSPEASSPQSLRKIALVLQRLKTVCEQNETSVLGIEQQIEPWATDADLALEAHHQVTHATEEMNQHITRTRELLLAQAKQIQKLNEKVSDDRVSADESLSA